MNDFSTLCDTATVPDVYDDGTDLSSMSMTVDFDGDGWAETTVIDTDADGVADVYAFVDPITGISLVGADTDGDGVLDAFAMDADGDGGYEDGWYDADGDGLADTSFDPSGSTTASDLPIVPSLDDSDTDTDTDTDTESETDDDDGDDGVHGDPMAEVPFHQAQVGPNDCLPTSVAMVLTEATGVEVAQGDVVDLANELDLLGPDGMTLEGGIALLDHWGVEAEVQTGSLDDLRTLLDQGTPIIIGLDADDLYGVGDQPFADDLASGHAVVITGIDDEAGLVYVNDPAFVDGAGVAVPIEDFEDAWIDAGNSMIVAEASDAGDSDGTTENDSTSDTTGTTDATDSTGTDESATEATSDGDDRGRELSLVDLVLLPLQLVVR